MRSLVLLLTIIAAAPTLRAACTLQLSEEGTIRIQSNEERTFSWNSVPGATSYYVEELIEGLGDPAAPDFTFGGPYTESRNYESRSVLTFHVNHAVTYKIRFHYTVTALNRDNPSWEPCSDDVLYVVEPDEELAIVSSLRIIPIAGKTRGRNGSDYATSLIIAGTGIGPSIDDPAPPPPPGQEPGENEVPKFYQGRIYFRPLGTTASDSDPSIEYAINGHETLVYDDIMATLGASGIGTLEVRPKIGYPTPLADAIIENRLPGNKRVGVRVPGVLGRHHLRRGGDSATVGIRSMNDTRLAFGARSLGAGGRLFFKHLAADGHLLGTAERYIDNDTTMTWALSDLFPGTLAAGHRVVAGYASFGRIGIPGQLFPSGKGVVLFLTETGNDLDNPGVVYRDALRDPHYSNGFDPFVVY